VTRDSARGRTGWGGREGWRARGMKVGMFVVRVIWPIKPRGGARRAPASRRSRIDDRRGAPSRPREATTAVRVRRASARMKRDEKRCTTCVNHASPRARRTRGSAYRRTRFPSCGSRRNVGRPRLHRGRDTSSSRDALPVWRFCRLAVSVTVFEAGKERKKSEREREREREREKKSPSCRFLSQCSSRVHL